MTFAITAKPRVPGKASDDRIAGRVPVVLYGSSTAPVSLSVDPLTFSKLYEEAGESTLIDFSIEGQDGSSKVLIQDVQFDPLKEVFNHVDFLQINMNAEMHANLELNFIGEAPAVKALGGTLITQKEEVEIKCLPKDLVNHIDVDISALVTFEDVIYIKDLPFPSGVTPIEDGELLVAKVTAPLTEDQLKALEESQIGDVATVEVDKKKEAVEGAEAEGAEKKEKK